MNPTRTGIILYTQNYTACVAFYRDTLELPIMFDTADLTCFALGETYLMVEIDDRENTPERPLYQNFCLRMNVSNVRDFANKLAAKDIHVDYQEHAWGTVAKFTDPDGNLCALRDDESFEKQVKEHS